MNKEMVYINSFLFDELLESGKYTRDQLKLLMNNPIYLVFDVVGNKVLNIVVENSFEDEGDEND